MPGFTGIELSVVGDIPVDSETPVVTSLVSSVTSLVSSQVFVSLVFEGAHMGSICMRVHRGEFACVVSVYIVLCNLKISHHLRVMHATTIIFLRAILYINHCLTMLECTITASCA